MMDQKWVDTLKEDLKSERSEALLKMLNGDEEYPDETYEAAEQILLSRGIPLPYQKQQASKSIIPKFPELKQYIHGLGGLTLTNLQQLADYRFVKNTLILSGIASIVFGLIAIGLGIRGMEHSQVNAILAFIGFLLTIEGIWLLVAQTPTGMIVDAVAVMVIGVWNLFVASVSGGIGIKIFLGGLGMAQIGWASRRFILSKHLSKMPRTKPSPETLERLDHIVKEISEAKMADNPYIVEFKEETSSGNEQMWKGLLTDSCAIFVEISAGKSAFVKKQKVIFTSERQKLIGKKFRGVLSIGDRKMKGTISRETFERYLQWKQAVA